MREAPTPKTHALMEAMTEARAMKRQGVSAEDIARGIEPLLRELIPQKTPREFICDRCQGSALAKVMVYSELYECDVERVTPCLCTKGQEWRNAHTPSDEDVQRRRKAKKAEQW